MKSLMSTRYSSGALNTAFLILRLGLGILLVHHGYDKLTHFNEIKPKFMDFMGMGQSVSLSLVIFAEFFCSILVILGLFTRLACVPIIIVMCVALIKAHHLDFFGDGEKVTLYLTSFLALLLSGPGRASIDNMAGK